MNKTIINILLFVVLTISTNALASAFNVGPQFLIKGKIDNETILKWTSSYQFNSYNQDIFIFNSPLHFVIGMIKGDKGSFYIAYNNFSSDAGQPECKFTVSSTKKGIVTLTESPVKDGFLKCTITGNPQTNNLVIHLSMKPNKFVELH